MVYVYELDYKRVHPLYNGINNITTDINKAKVYSTRFGAYIRNINKPGRVIVCKSRTIGKNGDMWLSRV